MTQGGAQQGVLFDSQLTPSRPDLIEAPEKDDEPWRPVSSNRSSATDEAVRKKEAKRSLLYMADVALRYGRLRDVDTLVSCIVQLRRYKPYNALLILLQRPAATFVLPADDWAEKYGYRVRPEEQPLVLLQPHGPVMFLFDRSQVEAGPQARPLPYHLQNPFGMADWPEAPAALRSIISNTQQDGVRVTEKGLGLPYAGYITAAQRGGSQEVTVRRTPPQIRDVPVKVDILLNNAYTSTEQLATLAHELGHLYCGHLGRWESAVHPGEFHWGDRSGLPEPVMELEAETVAKIVMRTLGVTSRLPDHLHQYFEEEPRLEGVGLEVVLTAAGWILEMASRPTRRRAKSTKAT